MKNTSDIVVALSVIVCAAILLGALIFAIVGNPFREPHLRFSIDFANVAGISPTSSVNYAGDPVGVVERIEHLPPEERIDPDQVVRVHVAILEPVKLPSNLSASINSASLLGEKFVSLRRIDDQGDLLADGARLSADAPGTLLENFIPGASETFEKVDQLVTDLSAMAERLNRGPEGERLMASLTNMEGFTENLNTLTLKLDTAFNGDEDTAGLIGRLDTLATDLQSMTSGLKELMEGTENEEGLNNRAKVIVENLAVFSEELKQTLAGEGDEPGLTEKMNRIADEINTLIAGPPDQPEEAVRHQLLDLTERIDGLTEELQVMVVWGQYLTGTLAEKPSRLIFGKKADGLPEKEEILRYLRQHGEPFPVEIPPEEPESGNTSGAKPGLFRRKIK